MLQIRQSSRAWQDIVEISLFVAKDNLSAADAFVDAVERKLELLANHPELGERRPELGQGIRCLSMGSYLLVYRIATDTIELLRVVHAARDIDAIF